MCVRCSDAVRRLTCSVPRRIAVDLCSSIACFSAGSAAHPTYTTTDNQVSDEHKFNQKRSVKQKCYQTYIPNDGLFLACLTAVDSPGQPHTKGRHACPPHHHQQRAHSFRQPMWRSRACIDKSKPRLLYLFEALNQMSSSRFSTLETTHPCVSLQ